ncbi:MAG: LysR family transcriptional regulator [Thermoanaerobaculia bacterium]
MTLDQLRIFVEVAERQHMTKAAAALHITQSTASAAIAALESQHEVRLFHRVGRRIELTEAGHKLQEEAKAILGRVANAELVLAELGALKRGTLRLVASQTIASYWLPHHLADFRRQYPGIAIDLVIGNTGQAIRAISDGSAELGFAEGAIPDVSISHWPVGHDQLVLTGSSEYSPMTLTKEELARARWVMREPGSGTRSTFEEMLRARGVDPAALDVALTLPSNESVLSAVEAGAGVAVLSALVVARATNTAALHSLPFDDAPRLFSALCHKERTLSKAADALLTLIREANHG